ncbi:ceramide kinase-like protein isoform X1 [Poecilia latipinna]|uniref:ceramide kinase-like protein isoform X1 n=1 Tax=Poecilia latipinna TaxID=48699 RepID=UPI00072E8747|nr:PREDICTED: ceramide kinase-like protein isoform X1 [Poecilia latipinna]
MRAPECDRACMLITHQWIGRVPDEAATCLHSDETPEIHTVISLLLVYRTETNLYLWCFLSVFSFSFVSLSERVNMSELEVEAQGESRDSSKKKKKKKKEKRRVSEEEEEEEEERKQEEQVEKEKEKSESVLMRGIFKVGKKSHDVLLTRTRLTWTPIIPESPTGEGSVPQAGEVLLQDVFAVKVKRRRMAGQQSGGAVLGLALFHSRRRGQRLEEDTLHLHNASAEHTHSWYNTLKELLTGFSTRPRYVKVFINPSSHKKEAVHIYRDHVAPLFKMADVRTDITATPQLSLSLLSADGTISVVPLFLLAAIKHTQPLTDRKGHALSVMKECKLDEYDGVVCVGGDGSVAELCHALVLRAQLDADSPENPVRAALPLGIIPAGSTDVVSCSVHGVRDPVTAALHVVLGTAPLFLTQTRSDFIGGLFFFSPAPAHSLMCVLIEKIP